jgi:LuxR family maltose regulon positive regulatory protein
VCEQLSEREREVLGLLAEGLSYRETGQRLFVSLPTIKTHVSHIYGKLGVHDREAALERASELGLLCVQQHLR